MNTLVSTEMPGADGRSTVQHFLPRDGKLRSKECLPLISLQRGRKIPPQTSWLPSSRHHANHAPWTGRLWPLSHVSPGPPSPVPHAPADKGVPFLPNFLTLSSPSTGCRSRAEALSEVLGRGPGNLAKPAGCTCFKPAAEARSIGSSISSGSISISSSS